jgi:glycosyltransferase involved in cell wall biosynthesis
MDYKNVAVIIPCHNEAASISQVVAGFKNALPKACIYVYDNCSTDTTQDIAKKAGAIIGVEKKKGKGNVVRRMFADVEADIYLLVDGDLTYDPTVAPEMIDFLIENKLDMLNISRLGDKDSYRSGHRLGNYLLTTTVKKIFGTGLEDMLSGYRIFSRKFVKTFPSRSNGFEIESELTVHSLEMKLPFGERPAPYIERPEGSVSKLATYSDGLKILLMIARLFFLVKPIVSFSIVSGVLFITSLVIGWIQVINPLLNNGVITKYPSVVLSSSLMVLSMLLFVSGLVVDSVSSMRKDQFRLFYLNTPSNNKTP